MGGIWRRKSCALSIAAMFVIVLFVPDSAWGMRWEYSVQSALTKSSKDGKPVLIYAYTRNCKYCTKMEHGPLKDRSVLALLDRFHCAKLNCSNDPSSASKYGVQGVPMMIILTPSGSVAGKISGYVHAATLKQRLKQFVTTGSPLPQKTTLRTPPTTPSAERIFAQAESEFRMGAYRQSLLLFEECLKSSLPAHEQSVAKSRIKQIRTEKIPEQLLNDARRASQGGDTVRSWNLCRQALKMKPSPTHEKRARDLQNQLRDAAAKELEESFSQLEEGKLSLALETFQSVARGYAGSLEAARARAQIFLLQSDQETTQHIESENRERRAHSSLQLAENYRSAGMIDLAREAYTEVIEKHPKTTAAQEATQRLQTLGQEQEPKAGG